MRKAELVFIPNPGMGHLISTIELAKILLCHHAGMSAVVLILNLHSDSSMINTYVESLSRGSDHSCLTFLTLLPLSNPPDPSSQLFNVDIYKPFVKQAVKGRMRSGSPKPAGFVLDMFFTSIMDVADELSIPSYIFTSGATFLNLIFHFQSLAHDSGINIFTEFDNPDAQLDLPGFQNCVPGKVLPRVFFDKVFGHKMILNNARRYRKSKGILVNTFMVMQSNVIKLLINQYDENKIPAVYPVGPILGLENKISGGSKSKKKEEESIMEWLNEQPDSSVVFLCFGSMGSFDEAQVKEIANGLDRAGYGFLWSLRWPSLEDKNSVMPIKSKILMKALPKGFINRIGNRGKIIEWAPQVSVLAHQAAGGFVSHCGWNST